MHISQIISQRKNTEKSNQGNLMLKKKETSEKKKRQYHAEKHKTNKQTKLITPIKNTIYKQKIIPNYKNKGGGKQNETHEI